MSTTLTKLKYTQALRDIRIRIDQGRASAEAAYQREAMRTNWEVGRIITDQLLPDSVSGPSAANARMIRQLAADLGKPRTFIYRLVKFYRCYPQLPETDLTWSHYTCLTYVENEYLRQRLEKKAIKEGISSKKLYQLVINKKNTRHPEGAKRPKDLKLSVTRGELHFYRCLRRNYIPLKKNERLVDIGFKILRKTKTPAWKSQSHGLHIRSYKEDGVYSLRIARPADHKLYTYVATLERVIDGDTLVLNIDLGFDAWIQEKVRLRGIDCPEITTRRGAYAKDYVKKLLAKQKFIIVKTYKDDKYGRMLADVFYGKKPRHPKSGVILRSEATKNLKSKTKVDPAVVAKEGKFLNQVLLDENLAELWT